MLQRCILIALQAIRASICTERPFELFMMTWLMLISWTRLDYSGYVPGGFGTGDLVIVADGVLEIIDFKGGRGVRVDADRNSQLMLYALGALTEFDALYDIQSVA